MIPPEFAPLQVSGLAQEHQRATAWAQEQVAPQAQVQTQEQAWQTLLGLVLGLTWAPKQEQMLPPAEPFWQHALPSMAVGLRQCP